MSHSDLENGLNVAGHHIRLYTPTTDPLRGSMWYTSLVASMQNGINAKQMQPVNRQTAAKISQVSSPLLYSTAVVICNSDNATIEQCYIIISIYVYDCYQFTWVPSLVVNVTGASPKTTCVVTTGCCVTTVTVCCGTGCIHKMWQWGS